MFKLSDKELSEVVAGQDLCDAFRAGLMNAGIIELVLTHQASIHDVVPFIQQGLTCQIPLRNILFGIRTP